MRGPTPILDYLSPVIDNCHALPLGGCGWFRGYTEECHKGKSWYWYDRPSRLPPADLLGREGILRWGLLCLAQTGQWAAVPVRVGVPCWWPPRWPGEEQVAVHVSQPGGRGLRGKEGHGSRAHYGCWSPSWWRQGPLKVGRRGQGWPINYCWSLVLVITIYTPFLFGYIFESNARAEVRTFSTFYIDIQIMWTLLG